MPLFQTSVLNKYLAKQDKQLLEQQYTLYRSYFLNATIQKNIIASKEEEFQEGFLRELFVKVLGYTINPEPDYNLKTELKNIKDSKKADGAIVDGEKVLSIIELKGTDTINLNQIEIQAFGYKNNQDNCRYVITSNFQKLRFYIDNAIEFLEWDLFKLDFENFKLLYLCLGKENIFKNLAATIKVESVTVEENVTKRLYKEYSGFRKALFNNIAELNENTDKLLLFKKTQKLLDRFLFLFFAEDRMLVPPNSVRKILEQWNSLKDMDAYQPLYARFKLYFGYLNTGHKGKQHDIFAYNGGLFAPDEILDNVVIDDAILYEATLSLSNYDYNSEIDVNILGHIFEHSLTEIEELENEITSPTLLIATLQKEKGSGKRKKDGVFYTPKYITKYIVENTVGTLCKNKKLALKIEEADYHPLQKKKALKILLDTLHAYREWLLKITIIDPACGSGAFLNQALEFLIAEHKFISELEANITGSSIVFDVENSILENNLFGVDINEESVEIAKLSLWLRTARKGRKLNSLNNNIKCGNSLIDDETVAGEKAFVWEREFPQVFGEYIEPLDVVKNKIAAKKKNLESETTPYTFTPYKEPETSGYPAEKITNYDDGIVNTDFNIVNEPEVEYLTEKKGVRGFDVVIGNPPYVSSRNIKEHDKIFFKKKYLSAKDQYDLYVLFMERGETILKENGFLSFITPDKFLVAKYGEGILDYLKDKTELLSFWDLTNQNVFVDASVYPVIFNFQKVRNNFQSAYTKKDFANKSIEVVANKSIFIIDKISTISTAKFKVWRPLATTKNIVEGKNNVVSNGEIGKYYANPIVNKDSNGSREIDKIGNKVILKKLCYNIEAFYDDVGLIPVNTTYCITSTNEIHLKFILALLNSKLMTFYARTKYINTSLRGGYIELRVFQIEELPIINIAIKLQQPFIEKADLMLSKNAALQEATKAFIKLLQAKFETININTKLEKWYNLSFADFSKELSKQKIKLTLSQESEWLSFFEQEKQKALTIKNEIDAADAEIDKMVYALYGLSEEEVRIVEGD